MPTSGLSQYPSVEPLGHPRQKSSIGVKATFVVKVKVFFFDGGQQGTERSPAARKMKLLKRTEDYSQCIFRLHRLSGNVKEAGGIEN